MGLKEKPVCDCSAVLVCERLFAMARVPGLVSGAGWGGNTGLCCEGDPGKVGGLTWRRECAWECSWLRRRLTSIGMRRRHLVVQPADWSAEPSVLG